MLGYGRDLKGTSWPEVADDLNYVIVPLANPDARARMPNSFVGLALQDILHYDAGLTFAGERYDPAGGDCDPTQMMVLGGLFNDAGQHINRDNEPESLRSPEEAAVMGFMAQHRPDVVLEIHAHQSPPKLILPSRLVPEGVRARQRRLAERIIARAQAEGIDFDPDVPGNDVVATGLYHHFAGSAPILYESPQGTLDSPARWSHQEIIDGCLTVISALAAELMAEHAAGQRGGGPQ